MVKSKRRSRRVRDAKHISRAALDIPDRKHEPATGPEDSPIPFMRDSEEEDPLQMPSFPVVGVGASAGGLEAFTQLLQHLPADTGLAFVFIQHLAPQHPSMLASLLARTTAMPVMEVQHGTPVRADHVYVIPPNTLMRIEGDVLELEPRPMERGAPKPIDYFFRSLAVDQKTIAIGVVLSGADSDGALGLQAIRADGGIAIVQSESSAKHPDMPRTAIAAGTVDLVLSPEEIAGELARIVRHLSLSGREPVAVPKKNAGDESQLNRIFALIQAATRVDFRGYRRATIRRRITRRIIQRRFEGLEAYISDLESDRTELLALCEDLLINVTSFFRDPEVFLALEKDILPRLLQERSSNLPLRVWVPGCSTGEEVYSLAMCLIEANEKCLAPVPIQIFGTDISERAIVMARAATYAENQVTNVSPERQARFLTRVENGFQVVKSVREICVFARQNLLVDPPFSRLDLISCRNLLIYLESALQRQVAATFHYALQPNGYLMLGLSESLNNIPGLFTLVDRPHKFFTRKTARLPAELIGRGFAAEPQPSLPTPPAPSIAREKSFEAELDKEAERIVLSEYGPAWVIVNESFEILQSHGDTSPYLRLAPGRATLALTNMARECIRGELRKLLAKAKSKAGPAQSTILLESENGEVGAVQLEVRRMATPTSDGRCFLVLFFGRAKERLAEPREPSGSTRSRRKSKAGSADVERLRQELILTEQHLQSIIDERDAANEDLTSANEEIQSSNEELQSINEELETSKEELQSSNEELDSVNEELRNRVQELGKLSDDLANLLTSAAMPMMMIDNELRIRRLTTSAERLFGFQTGDIGRPIADIQMRLSMDDLEPRIRRVLETLNPEEAELQDRQGCWHVLHVRPYRTGDNRIEGAVLVLVDIDQARRAQIEADSARKFAESVVESVQTPLLVLRSDLRVRKANRAFFQAYHLRAADVENQFFYEVGGQQWNPPGLQTALEQLSADQESIGPLEFEQDCPGSGRRTVLIHARRLHPDGENHILVAVEDITAQKRAERILIDEQQRLQRSLRVGETALHDSEEALLRTREELRALTAGLLNAQEEERRRVSRELHDDLSQKVAKLQFDVETLEQQLPPNLMDGKRRLAAIRDEIGTLSNDLRRIAYELHPSTLDHLGLAVAIRTYSREFSEREGLPVQCTARKVPARVPPEVASALYRIVQEALRNVAKHAGKTSVAIALAGGSNQLMLSIRDHGVGFDKHAMQNKGGLGLIGMQERARLIRGEFSLETRPGRGAAIMIRVPLN
jgi:two-component system CheB/CheR fusion protein